MANKLFVEGTLQKYPNIIMYTLNWDIYTALFYTPHNMLIDQINGVVLLRSNVIVIA